MKRVFSLTLLLSFLLSSCLHHNEEKLNIAAAANMRFAMKEMVKKFEEQTGIESQLMISSSGKLTAQIKEGAPYDIFVSANMKYPEELFQSGFTTAKPEIYAYGKLILWTLKEDLTPSLDILKEEQIHHIAIANPKMAPYGIAAKECLEKLNLYDDIKNKIVFGESVSQTNQFIISKSADLGFTSKSVVFSSEMHGKGSWIEIDKNMYSAIKQGVVIIKQENKKEDYKEEFYQYLFSKEAQEILIKFGYSIDLN